MAIRSARLYDEGHVTSVTAGAGVPGDITDPTAIAGQVAWLMRGRIFDGTYPAGSELDSQLELARDFGYSEATINRAFAELARQGLVSMRSGRKTVVQPHRVYEVAVTVAAAGDSADPDAAWASLAERVRTEPALTRPPAGLLVLPAGRVVMEVRAANPAQAAVTGWAVLAAALGSGWDTTGAMIEVRVSPR